MHLHVYTERPEITVELAYYFVSVWLRPRRRPITTGTSQGLNRRERERERESKRRGEERTDCIPACVDCHVILHWTGVGTSILYLLDRIQKGGISVA